jgi:hypothetical protein
MENFLKTLISMDTIPLNTEAEQVLPSNRSVFDLIRQEFNNSQWQSSSHTSVELSTDAIQVLKQQTISEIFPGTILHDFQVLLDFVGDKGTAVSNVNQLLPIKSLAEINELLSEPIQLDLQRPVQKSYPPIDGLYLLLRASGLGKISTKGKKYFLTIDPTILAIWHSFNSTERYCTLLETWLIRAHPEMIGERGHANLGSKCFQFWPTISAKGKKISNYEEQSRLNFWPELRNVALLRLFGFIELDHAKPDRGKGARIKQVKKLPFGDAMMTLLHKPFGVMWWESEDNPSLPFAELQPTLQPYFPEWKNVLKLPELEFQLGVYIFKVHLRNCWRRIAISSDLTLGYFAGSILESVDFDTDHLDVFIYENQYGRSIQVHHPYSNSEPNTDMVAIGSLPLVVGSSMRYIFDFGDNWKFKIELEQIQADDPRLKYVEILEHHGKSPTQYPDWNEEE